MKLTSFQWDKIVKDLEDILKPRIYVEQWGDIWLVHIDGDEEVLDWCDDMLESNIFDIRQNAYIFDKKYEAERFRTLFCLKWQK